MHKLAVTILELERKHNVKVIASVLVRFVFAVNLVQQQDNEAS
jgi:hypothetical protein